MKGAALRIAALVLLCTAAVLRADTGVVASVHPLATEAGLSVMREGGNAIDAAVAVGLTLGVVDGHNSGIGGGCFMLIRTADGAFHVLDGRETAPAAATRDMFVREGKADTSLSQTGPLAVGVPGSLAVYEHAMRQHGRKTLSELLEQAAKVAEEGFEIDKQYRERVASVLPELKKWSVDSPVLDEKTRLTQRDLAASYRAIAREGTGWFYGGEFAEKLGTWMRENGGILAAWDFRDYQMKSREPVKTSYRGWEVVSFPPPSSGGVHVIQILNMLETFEMAVMTDPDRIHVTAEAMKLAFADRAYWLGDPDFTPVPMALISKDYAVELARRIDMQHALVVPAHGEPSLKDVFKHTTHFSTADGEGNWVACTATVNTPFGSKVTVPGTGIFLNNQMDDFSAQPGVPNAFGLIGGEANSIAPGKRPLSSMSPTIVLRDGEPQFAVGAAGGPKIISQVVLHLVNMIDRGMTAAESLAQPRFHHQWKPNVLEVEAAMPEAIVNELARRGHRIETMKHAGISVIATKNGAAIDPRLRR